MAARSTFLVLGATGGTGQHLVKQVLADGHRVRALARTPSKLRAQGENLDIVQGSITEDLDLDALVDGVDYVVAMLGDRATQQEKMICSPFIQKLVPAMRRKGVRRMLFQAGALSSYLQPSEEGPHRKYYALTTTGTALLHEATKTWHEFTATVGRLLDEETAA